jgi:hypothetical protein
MHQGPARALCFLSTAAKALFTTCPQDIHSPARGKRRIPNAFCGGLWKRVSSAEFIFLLPDEFAYDGARGGKPQKWPWRNRARTLVRANRLLIHSS